MREAVERREISEEDVLARIDASIPLRRSNSPEDIAGLALFMASDATRNVTGESWNVDGGLVND